ncbi:MAG: uracil-DNA glycosylase [Deltaproteobacteria bacterium]|nr:uracil-DNA glycosylase [Deltaproteobacteria bacterium]
MVPPVVAGEAVRSKIFLVGQAPGAREGSLGRPFAWTAGKTLFRWFEGIGVDEATFRARAHMAAVARCFPGKASGGGDRVPSQREIEACRPWMEQEAELQRPELVIPVGGLAIRQILDAPRLADVIGREHECYFFGRTTTCVPLPHPSGASTWHRTEPGRSLLERALGLLAEHPAWGETFGGAGVS